MWEKKNALYITTAKVSRKGAGAIPKVEYIQYWNVHSAC
jgi:hypothetical protein